MSENLEDQIQRATDRSGKTYSFKVHSDTSEPIAHWFQQSPEGLVLFIVFYTQACRWSLCTGCNLPSESSRGPVDWRSIVEQIDRVLSAPEVSPRLSEIGKVIVSNNGSVLDQSTFGSTALMHLLVQLNLKVPNMRVVAIETRPEYVEVEELEFIARAMHEREVSADIEIAVGFEAFDDHLRNKVFLKGLSLAGFEKLVEQVSAHSRFRLKCYFMQKPVVEFTDEAALADVKAGIDYLSGVAERSGVRINMHLNPTFAARGTPLATAFEEGRFNPPLLRDVVRAVLHARTKKLEIFVGLYDEGLAVEGGSFVRPGDEPLIAALERFNQTQDFDTLESECQKLGVEL